MGGGTLFPVDSYRDFGYTGIRGGWVPMSDVYYFHEPFNFVWDVNKNQQNIKKHGIDFKTAAMVFDDDFRLEYPDPEHSITEERYRTIGLVHNVLAVVYCDRVNAETGDYMIRLISARTATKLEKAAYNNNVTGRR